MAMTKKERAAFDAALRAARIAGALRWTSPVAPDVPPPSWAGGVKRTLGWDFNAYNATVREYWSEITRHGNAPYEENNRYQAASQNSKSLYSTKALALKALRYAVELECAEKLARIDAQIADAQNAQ